MVAKHRQNQGQPFEISIWRPPIERASIYPKASLDPEEVRQLGYALRPVRNGFGQASPSAYAVMPEGNKPQQSAKSVGSRRLGLSLRFISGKYEGGEFPLEEGKDIIVGRSSELDMVLVEEMVSRKHAKITVRRGAITIEDLGSTNGSFVNGERIQQATLHEGDRILIGTSILKVVSDTATASDSKSSLKAVAERRRQAHRRSGANPGSDEPPRMTGHLDEVPLPDLLQLFSTSRKSGVLVLHHEERVGKVFLDEGRIHFALIEEHPEILPFKAIYRMIDWSSGVFELEPPETKKFEGPLDAAVPEVLMEVLRQQDEMGNLREKIPPMDATLQLRTPMAAPLNELEPRQLDVLQLALNCQNVLTLLERSKYSDLDTAKILAELLSRGYLQVSGRSAK